MQELKLQDEAQLIRDLPLEGLKKGKRGPITAILDDSFYEVAFTDPQGEVYATAIVRAEDLRIYNAELEYFEMSIDYGLKHNMSENAKLIMLGMIIQGSIRGDFSINQARELEKRLGLDREKYAKDISMALYGCPETEDRHLDDDYPFPKD